MQEKYDPKLIEPKWQLRWENEKLFKAEPSSTKKKYYCLCMFPYPSGAIHMGHVRNYSIGDAVSRFKRMQGFNVMQPIGWDAFGLPAENAANERGIHPKEWTLLNISQMKEEFKTLGISYDWDREIATCLPTYYKWEQLFFIECFKKGLAYKKKGLVNWCENCQTVLANEQVNENRCWRCNNSIIEKELNQWYLKITLYAEELLQGHDLLKNAWPEKVIEMQRHWIGKSFGALIHFKMGTEVIEVFTTRPDTLFGVTFVTLSPFHPLSEKLCQKNSLSKKLETLRKKPFDNIEKEGFFTESYCEHPITSEKIPIWIGNFVLMEYGTGSVMAVPAHDSRDFEFAKKYNLPLKQVIEGESTSMDKAYEGNGLLINSGDFTGLSSDDAKKKITTYLSQKNKGHQTTQYRLRDWGISRQRYWGTPIPIIYCDTCQTVPVPIEELPIELPMDVSFSYKGGNPLERHPTFSKTQCPKCGKQAKRETDTMDTFVESSWYYARFASPHTEKSMFDFNLASYWLPVDCYIGGIEHACMHLLYARFFHRVLRNWKWLSHDEPFTKLLTQGMVVKDGAKMSKSKGNVVTPSSILTKYGADTARLFSLFAAPMEKDLEWSDQGVEGGYRFLLRVWRLFYQFHSILTQPVVIHSELPYDLLKIRKKAHWMIKKMTEDLNEQKFNTAISSAMELVNEIYFLLSTNEKAFESHPGVLLESLRSLALVLAPFAPHLSEELWSEMKQEGFVSMAQWPSYENKLLQSEVCLVVIQVNGKVREKLTLPLNLSQEKIIEQALTFAKVKNAVGEKKIQKAIFVPNKLINLVVQ